jgi:G:T/U-mismatch repair DNA glycosylase
LKILPKNFHLPIIVLPSTSPAYASLKYEEKLLSWQGIKNYLP